METLAIKVSLSPEGTNSICGEKREEKVHQDESNQHCKYITCILRV